jgi:hypothetical protein
MSGNNYLIYFQFRIISLQQNCMNQQCYYDKKLQYSCTSETNGTLSFVPLFSSVGAMLHQRKALMGLFFLSAMQHHDTTACSCKGWNRSSAAKSHFFWHITVDEPMRMPRALESHFRYVLC